MPGSQTVNLSSKTWPPHYATAAQQGIIYRRFGQAARKLSTGAGARNSNERLIVTNGRKKNEKLELETRATIVKIDGRIR